MATFKTPALSIEVKTDTDCKNSAILELQQSQCIDCDIISHKRGSIILNWSGKNLLLTTIPDENNLEEVDFAILSNSPLDQEHLESVTLKKWLKHPLIKHYTPAEITSSWNNKFNFIEETPNQPGLRLPQIAALHALLSHVKVATEIATVVMPTGTGKTETMLSVLISNKIKRLLVTVPSDSLRTQIADKFKTLGLLKQFGILDKEAINPIVGILKHKFNNVQELAAFFQNCNVIVTTMDIVTGLDSECLEMVNSLCSYVFIDEAHHVEASTWDTFRKSFPPNKVVQFTATPFRNDGKRLEGKIIFNFPLRLAQEQGYFQHINFIPVRIYDPAKSDKHIADIAIKRLRDDIKSGYNHILMARCQTKERAKKVFELYKDQSDLNPVLIYSGISGKKEIQEKILCRQAKIIVCVNMLGEGFDLPELKIAAFHDIRKSLPVTLQFAGRFTRTKFDEQLGEASFIANIADLYVTAELEELYAQDADWNKLLSSISTDKIQNQVDYQSLLADFPKLSDANIPFQNIKPKLSTVVYKNKTNTWFPGNFIKAIPDYENLDYKFHDINSKEKILVVITAKKEDVDWVKSKDIFHLQWNLLLVYWDTKNNLLFINSSDNSSLYKELAEAIIGENAELIRGINVFRAFYNIKRTRLQNVGLRHFLGKNIRFRLSVGYDVAEALSLAEKQQAEKAFVIGAGFEDGEQVNIGCSYKGRIWTKLVGDLKQFINWSINVGKKLVDETIDPNQILRETLIPELVSVRPQNFPVWIDWDDELLNSREIRFKFNINGFIYDLSRCEIVLANPSEIDNIMFSLKTDDRTVDYELVLFEKVDEAGNKYPDFKINQITQGVTVSVEYGSRKKTPQEFFYDFPPTIWFADGAALTGNEYIKLKQDVLPYPKDKLIQWNWTGVNLSNESQGVTPKKKDSIQYRVIQELRKQDWDIIYDDDYSGEIADIVTIKMFDDHIKVQLHHLKYAIDGIVSNQIKNLYEVCGQAQKSIHWKFKSGDDFFNHLLRRQIKTKNGIECSRIEKGSIEELEKLSLIAKRKMPMRFEIFIVQPSISKTNTTPEILTLLGVTENFTKDIAQIELKIICSQ